MSRLARLFVVAGLALSPPVSVAAQEAVDMNGTDSIGSVRVVFDASGNVVGRMDYGPFGEQVTVSTVGQKSYAGLFRDGEAGLDYAEARSYEVRTGRFNAPDPVYAGLFEPQAWNRYGYALNNPLSFVDPTGLVADSCTTTETWSQDGDNWILNTTLKCKDNNGGGGGGSWGRVPSRFPAPGEIRRFMGPAVEQKFMRPAVGEEVAALGAPVVSFPLRSAARSRNSTLDSAKSKNQHGLSPQRPGRRRRRACHWSAWRAAGQRCVQHWIKGSNARKWAHPHPGRDLAWKDFRNQRTSHISH